MECKCHTFSFFRDSHVLKIPSHQVMSLFLGGCHPEKNPVFPPMETWKALLFWLPQNRCFWQPMIFVQILEFFAPYIRVPATLLVWWGLKCTVPVRPNSKGSWKKMAFFAPKGQNSSGKPLILRDYCMFHTNSLKEKPFRPGLGQADENASSAQDLMVFCHTGEGSEMPRPTTWDG